MTTTFLMLKHSLKNAPLLAGFIDLKGHHKVTLSTCTDASQNNCSEYPLSQMQPNPTTHKLGNVNFIYLFIQHLLSALYTNKHALMRYLINIYIHSSKYS